MFILEGLGFGGTENAFMVLQANTRPPGIMHTHGLCTLVMVRGLKPLRWGRGGLWEGLRPLAWFMVALTPTAPFRWLIVG